MIASRLESKNTVNRRSRSLRIVCSGLRARWCIDVRYGCKQDATALLQEWVRDVGSLAGLNKSNTRLSGGSIGVPESRLEMEVSFQTLAEWEQFLSSIPYKEHKAWSQRIQSMIINDDSPKWEVFRVIPVEGLEGLMETGVATSSKILPSVLDQMQMDQRSFPRVKAEEVPRLPSSSIYDSPGGLTIIEDSASADVILDWKGDPMKINPGDQLPFKFL
ncbi:hypothetical protein CEUSTIGMA_g2965.t1 [Chlamydomonas eustigma]|uniref:Uncharacterized protein n=1 Tax=Chlamydomonas eustigma TaxID=1157962 RepID=A0A250WY45_9CHLO|nr:hypothetical protein CEUSTIGMA_g2965.t1 [Chlamydomonas eustigma]|eukprot:GAX75522.1 hypothetical protein CEUSTIGMA_g2965.t1 [Chlamydomonas eustigma]